MRDAQLALLIAAAVLGFAGSVVAARRVITSKKRDFSWIFFVGSLLCLLASVWVAGRW